MTGRPSDGDLEPRSSGSESAWGPVAEDIAIVVWPSFLAAAVATMVFFAFIDPLALREATFPTWNIGRMAGYAIGFFFFWVIAATASALTLFLRETAHRKEDGPGGSGP